MMIHLENGCNTSVGELDQLARQCYQWRKYVVPEFADYLEYSNAQSASPGRPYVFKCPTCDTRFKYLSALLQHVESDTCNEVVYENSSYGPSGSLGKLMDYLWRRM